jgi:hypothetical protein
MPYDPFGATQPLRPLRREARLPTPDQVLLLNVFWQGGIVQGSRQNSLSHRGLYVPHSTAGGQVRRPVCPLGAPVAVRPPR